MFSLRSFIRANRPQSEDELISAFLDGQLDQGARRAFESRINADPALRRRVEATRTVLQVARALPPVQAPRNFTLLRNMGAAVPPPQSNASAHDLRMWWRLGSAVAAMVFVVTVGLDAGGVLAPGAAQLAPSAALQPAQSLTLSSASALTSTPSSKQAAGAAQMATAANPASDNAAPAPPQAPTPAASVRAAVAATKTETLTTGAAAPEGALSQITPTESAVLPPQRLSDTNQVTETAQYSLPVQPTAALQPANTPPPSAPRVPELAAPAHPPPTEPDQPAPALILDRIVAIAALLAAIGLGIVGWLRR